MKKLYFIFIILSTFIFISCKTNRIDSPELIEKSSNLLGQMKASNESLNMIITNSETRISKAIDISNDMANDLDKLEYLFKQYNNEVDIILKELKKERDKNAKLIEQLEKLSNKGNSNE